MIVVLYLIIYFICSDPVVDVRQRAFSVLAGCLRIAKHSFVQVLVSRLPAPIKTKSAEIGSSVL